MAIFHTSLLAPSWTIHLKTHLKHLGNDTITLMPQAVQETGRYQIYADIYVNARWDFDVYSRQNVYYIKRKIITFENNPPI